MKATAEDLCRARRVLVYGVSGAGRTTAALAFGEPLDLPVTLVDEGIGWLPADEAWLLDSAYGSFLDLVLPVRM